MKLSTLHATLLMVGALILPSAYAANMSKADYDTGKDRIAAEYKQQRAACDAMSGNSKDVCQEEAKGKEKVAKAELEANYTGKASDHNKVLVARAEADYKVAKERCDDLSGNAKDVCEKEAKAAETKAKADAKMKKNVREERNDVNKAARDADYKVAAEKCDALAGDAKTACVNQAKAQFGK